MIYYKIRDRATGLYSMGGSHLLDDHIVNNPDARMRRFGWSRKGKIWKGLGPLKNHLNQYAGKIPEDWEVVAFEVKEELVGLRPAKEYLEKRKIQI